MQPEFESFSAQHASALLVFGLVTLALIRHGRKADDVGKVRLAVILAGLTFSSLVIESLIKLSDGTYDYLTDAPFFLCDIVALMLPFIIFSQNRKWIGILYFWALAGTTQALITPELEHGFPSFHFFRYFFTHAGIVMTVLYVIVVWKIKINWKDFLNAIMYIQFYIVAVHIINHLLGSNYSYTIQKPHSASLLDMLGPWPWYLFWAEILMVLLFLVLMIPFMGRNRHRDNHEDRFPH